MTDKSNIADNVVRFPPRAYLRTDHRLEMKRHDAVEYLSLEECNELVRAARAEAFEAAAKEAESWWGFFNFDSFEPGDIRRAANPNQIAVRIRCLGLEAARAGERKE